MSQDRNRQLRATVQLFENCLLHRFTAILAAMISGVAVAKNSSSVLDARRCGVATATLNGVRPIIRLTATTMLRGTEVTLFLQRIA